MDQPETPMTTPLYAVLIGVDDYSAYDASAGLPVGTSDLRGAVNDVRLFKTTLAKLGVPEVNIRLYVTGGGAKSGEATRASIETGLDWLQQTLTATEGSRGVVLFCGHGDSDARGPLLCPSDTTQAMTQALSFEEVAARLDKRGQKTDVSFFLDACHAAPGADGGAGVRRRVLRDHAAGPARPRALRRNDDVVLAGSGSDEPSYEYELHGTWNGAFTWAVTSLLDRWGRSPNGEAFALTWGNLLRRTREILQDLAVDQRPEFSGPKPELRSYVLGGRAARRNTPPQDAGGVRELPGGMDGYILSNNSGTSIGVLKVFASTLEWRFTSQSVAWPTPCNLKKTGTPPSNTPYVVTTTRDEFPTTPGSYSVTGLKYKVKQNNAVVGYMHITTTAYVWYSIDARTEFSVADMQFIANGDTGYKTLYRVSDAIL